MKRKIFIPCTEKGMSGEKNECGERREWPKSVQVNHGARQSAGNARKKDTKNN